MSIGRSLLHTVGFIDSTSTNISDGAVRTILAAILGRSFMSAGFAFVQESASDLLLSVNQNNHARAQRLMARIETLSTMVSFMLTPVIGALVDSVGRKPALMAGPLLSFCARMLMVVAPSNASYVVYRVLNLIKPISRLAFQF